MIINKKGEAGIGTLIILIAMIFVAIIASGVLAQTAFTLQQKSLSTAAQSRQQLTTAMEPLYMYAEDGSNGGLEDFRYRLKLRAGSGPIRLDAMVLQFDSDNASVDLKYTNGSCENNFTSGYYSNSSTEKGNYTVKYSIKGDLYVQGYLQRGDVVELCFRAPREMREDESVLIALSPKSGTSLIQNIVMPHSITMTRHALFP